MGEGLATTIIWAILLIALLVAFVPAISDNITNADDQRACTDSGHPYECFDNDDGLLNWCTNETVDSLHCVPPLTVYNVTAGLCTNASGVSAWNASRTSVCSSTGWADGIVAYEDVGLSPLEVTLLGLIILFLVIGIVFGVAKEAGLVGN